MISVTPNAVRVTREDIVSFEEELGTKLPSDYVAFLEEYNGGYPENNILELENASTGIQHFYGLKLELADDLRWQIEILAGGRTPTNSLPIAGLEGGDDLLMALDKSHYGRIYWWEHEIEQTRLRDMTLVAGSFTELMEKLKPYNPDEVDLSGYRVEAVWGNPDFRESLGNKE